MAGTRPRVLMPWWPAPAPQRRSVRWRCATDARRGLPTAPTSRPPMPPTYTTTRLPHRHHPPQLNPPWRRPKAGPSRRCKTCWTPPPCAGSSSEARAAWARRPPAAPWPARRGIGGLGRGWGGRRSRTCACAVRRSLRAAAAAGQPPAHLYAPPRLSSWRWCGGRCCSSPPIPHTTCPTRFAKNSRVRPPRSRGSTTSLPWRGLEGPVEYGGREVGLRWAMGAKVEAGRGVGPRRATSLCPSRPFFPAGSGPDAGGLGRPGRP